MKMIISGNAGKQLDAILEYSRQESEKYAAKLYNDIIDEIEGLLTFPQMAPVEPMLGEEVKMYRSLVVRRRYKVVYSVNDEAINVVDVWDCRQDPKRLRKRAMRGK